MLNQEDWMSILLVLAVVAAVAGYIFKDEDNG